MTRELPEGLADRASFTRAEYVRAMSEEYLLTEPQAAYELKKYIENGVLIKIGWGRYGYPTQKRVYSHGYTDQAIDVMKKVSTEYPDTDFQITELIQLNDFMNHQLVHNTLFVAVENDMMDFVFDSLWKTYPGRVMLKPSVTQYYKYLQDDEIVVLRLPSETPKGYDEAWMSKLEKIIVDVFTDKLISEIVPEGEKEAIIEGAFRDYILDEKTILHYARRKGADKEMRRILEAYRRALSV